MRFPYEYALIDQRLTKPGLVISGPDKPTDYLPALVSDGSITPELLADYGFILLLNTAIDNKGGIIHGNNLQFPHTDGQVGDTAAHFATAMTEEGILAMMQPADKIRSSAYTSVGYGLDVFWSIAEFLCQYSLIAQESMPKKFVHFVAVLQEKVAIEGIKGFDAEQKYPHADASWRDVLFKSSHFLDGPLDKYLLDYPLKQQFTDALASSMYFHRWEANQTLLVDNTLMVHCRVPTDMQSNSPEEILRAWFAWKNRQNSTQGIYVLLGDYPDASGLFSEYPNRWS